jgi:hypothetical protein
MRILPFSKRTPCTISTRWRSSRRLQPVKMGELSDRGKFTMPGALTVLRIRQSIGKCTGAVAGADDLDVTLPCRKF